MHVMSRSDAGILDRLRQAAGADNVLPDDQLARYDVAGVTPRAVVAPDSVEAAAATLRLCSENGWPVEPVGAATWLTAGAPPAAAPVVITTARLNRVRDYEPANLVVGVEAGLSTAQLEHELSRHRQTVPLDPPALFGAGAPPANGDDAAQRHAATGGPTFGAIAALASAGPLRAGHGTPRDMIIGIELVTGDGRVVHFGARVVKNVAGYDLMRFMIGSCGAFGLITSMYIRLRAAPDLDITTAVPVPTGADALRLAADIRRRMAPDALDVIGPALAAQVVPAASASWVVLVRLRGNEAAVAEGSQLVQRITGAAGQTLSGADARRVWDAAGSAEAAAPLCLRAADLPSRLPATLAAVTRLTESISASDNDSGGWHVAIHAADGIVRTWPVVLPDAGAQSRLVAVLPGIRAELGTGGGTVTCPIWFPWPSRAPPGAGALAQNPDRAGPAARQGVTARGSDAQLRLLQELKAQFDPAHILSPGRHLFGI